MPDAGREAPPITQLLIPSYSRAATDPEARSPTHESRSPRFSLPPLLPLPLDTSRIPYYNTQRITQRSTHMTTISIRIPDDILTEVDRFSRDLKVPRTEYLRQAILLMNRKVKEDRRRVRIMKLSQRVRAESMRVNAEFSEVEHDPGY